MATTSKAPKSAKTSASAAPKAAPRGGVKAQAKTAPAAAKPAKTSAKKTSAAKGVAPNLAAKPTARPPQQPAKPALLPFKPQISGEQRLHYIEVAAYFIAERNGFSATSTLDHWTQAEAEIDRLLQEGKLNP